MTYLERLAEMRLDMTQKILDHMKSNDLSLIRFDQMFSCLLPVESGDYGPLVGSYIAKRMWDNGVIEGVMEDEGEWSEWSLSDLDSIEIAHILDTLEAGKYKVLDPDSYDVNEDEEDDEC